MSKSPFTLPPKPRATDSFPSPPGAVPPAMDTLTRMRDKNIVSALDQAILDHRENPTAENRQHVLDLQVAHVSSFFQTQADEFIERTT